MPVEVKRDSFITHEQIIKGVVPPHVKLCKKRPITKEMIIANTQELADARRVIGLPGKQNPKHVNQAYRVLEKYHV